ncbi:MAG: hypothetical protein A7315_09195 [Candidatus Altiarchaeales archaeon WOR_SM1_79]|nr:MAG: hypothetical protein A7315_09195 [Candidatus Altiarchaeales archaeon WOR_SM1_79]
MDKAFKVFVSSTFRDLEGERKEIRNNIDNISLESIGMESFVPSEKDAQRVCLDELSECDIYLLLIGKSYGSIIKECKVDCELKDSVCDGNISYTHCEYRTARNMNIPPICFSLLHDKKPDDYLEKFKEEVESELYLKPIKKDNLKYEVENALKKNIKRWVSEGKLNLPDFYGRKKELKELLETNAPTIFVKGIGGIGKTTLIEAFLLVKKIEGSEILEVVKERDINRTDTGYRLARDSLDRKEYRMLDLRYLAEILGIPPHPDDEVITRSIISALNNRNLILFVDDTHEIEDERVFDLIGRCSNSLTDGKIILAGRVDLKASIGKIIPVKKGVEDHEFIKSIFKENGKEKEWNKEISDKIMKITSGHPLAVKLVVRNLDYIDPGKFGNILKDAYDEKQAEEFIGRITKEILGEDGFEKTTSFSVHRIPFHLDNSKAKELIAKMILEKRDDKFFFTYDLIQEILYAKLKDKERAHKEASEYYKKFEGSSNYKGIAEYLYHLAKSRHKDAYDKYWKYDDILDKQGFYRELISINEVFLKGFKEIEDKAGESKCYTTLGNAYFGLGDFKKAIEYHEKALKIALGIGDKAGESACYRNLGKAYQGLGNFKKAIEYHEKALKIDLGIEDKAGESKCYTNLGNAYANLGDFKKAIEYHEKALKIDLGIEDKAGESKGYTNLGNAYLGLGDFKKAIEFYEKDLKIALGIEDKANESICYTNLGIAYHRLGDFKKAIEFYEKSLEIKLGIGNKAGESACYQGLGAAYDNLGDFKKAIEFYEKTLKIDLGIGDKAGESACYANLGIAYHRLGDFKKAIEYFEKSLEIFLWIGDKAAESVCYRCLGTAYGSLGDFKKAIEYHEKALKIDLGIGDKAGESACYASLGNAYLGLGNFKKAIEFYLKAEKIFKEIEQWHFLKRVYKNMAVTYRKMNNPEKAGEYRIKEAELS